MKPPPKKITWVSLTSVSPVVCLPGVSRSLDGFFVHAFVSASFPRKASNISLDFYFLDFIVNNKSQVTKQQNNFGFLVEMDKNGEQQDTKL